MPFLSVILLTKVYVWEGAEGQSGGSFKNMKEKIMKSGTLKAVLPCAP